MDTGLKKVKAQDQFSGGALAQDTQGLGPILSSTKKLKTKPENLPAYVWVFMMTKYKLRKTHLITKQK